jgi:serine/threonine protein kinase
MSSSLAVVPNGETGTSGLDVCVPVIATAPTAPTISTSTINTAKYCKTRVDSYGNFPMVGSRLGEYFCLGKLGKGTFCSIHKCCALNYWRSDNQDKKARIVAAKVELSQFSNSGVLEGEASMLSHLDSSLPPNTVPLYLGHLCSKDHSAILMEFLGGDDMHQLREAMGTRRIGVEDAVFLTTDVFIPLLQKMHDAGVVHRDVKPSNCVRRDGKDFLLVDFGLSKSIVVPKGSPHADKPFNDTHCFRKEREKADFRGTSMYASLRVHQLKDYAFRDDMWSVLYVFCDLVSGGLPWMAHAANRDRETCQKMKQDIFEKKEAEKLLQGEMYHLASYKRDRMLADGKLDVQPLPEPLELSNDTAKVKSLQEAFDHLGSLGFADRPDYGLLQTCLRRFCNGLTYDASVLKMSFQNKSRAFSPPPDDEPAWDDSIPLWDFDDIVDPMNDKRIWKEARLQIDVEDFHGQPQQDDAVDFARLPVELQFRIAQMNYHSDHVEVTPPHIALRDFMRTAIPLLYGEWDCGRYEKGNHSSNTDRFRRDLFLKVVEMCLKCASEFNLFSSKECYYDASEHPSKKRKIATSFGEGPLLAVSKIIVGLRACKAQETAKPTAPPAVLSFSQG